MINLTGKDLTGLARGVNMFKTVRRDEFKNSEDVAPLEAIEQGVDEVEGRENAEVGPTLGYGVWVFTDKDGETWTFNAQDRAEAYGVLADSFGAGVDVALAAGKLERTNSSDTGLCYDCSHPGTRHTPKCQGEKDGQPCGKDCRNFVKRDSDMGKNTLDNAKARKEGGLKKGAARYGERKNEGEKAQIVTAHDIKRPWMIADIDGRKLYGPYTSYSAAEADFRRRNLVAL